MKRLLLLFTICVSLFSFGQVPNYVPTNGLVGWWGFNGNANDESGNGNNGTVNGATLTTDRFGNPNSAYDFDGVNDLISLIANFDEPQRSVSAWFSLDAYSSIRQCILNNDYPQLTNGHTIFMVLANDSLNLQTGSGGTRTSPPILNQWYFICATRDDSTRYYINGQLILSTENATINSIAAVSQNLRLGVSRDNNLYFNGKIDDVGTWNRALTQCEISALYNAQTLSNPIVDLGGDTLSVCGTSTILDATDTSISSYNWSTGESTSSITVNSSGEYTVEVTDTNGCVGYDTTLVSIIDPTIDQIDTNICIGDSITLSVPNSTQSLACSHLPSNLQNGLIAYYPFCGNANDESGNGNDGTVNGATLTTDRFNNSNSAYSFDGVNDFVEVSHSNDFNVNTYTISAWVNANSFGDGSAGGQLGQRIIVSKRESTGWGSSYEFKVGKGTSTSNSIAASHTVVGTNISFGYSDEPLMNEGNWYFITYTQNTDSASLFFNGTFVNSVTSGDVGINNLNTFIGRRGNGSHPFDGIIDDVTMFNRVLTTAEIQQLYQLGNYDITWSTGDTTSSITVQPTTTTTYSVTVSDGISSCTDDITITVNDPQVDAGVDLDVCNGDDITLSGSGADTYAWSGGVTDGVAFGPTVSEYYYLTGTDTLGCEENDSVFVTVLQPTTSSITESACDTYTAPDGQTYTSTGNYTAVIPNAEGCDSTITIDLTITNSNTGSETVTECDSYTWNTNGQTYTQSGQYTEVLTNQIGCDSTVTLNLTINSSSSSTQIDTGLDSYTWSVNNQTYTQSGIYTAVIPNTSGCDSTITLDLTLQFTGLDENESSYVAVYPNPTYHSFILSTKDMIHMNYTLVNIQGKVVLTGKIESTEETVDISKLSKGQYNLVFEGESISPISIIKN